MADPARKPLDAAEVDASYGAIWTLLYDGLMGQLGTRVDTRDGGDDDGPVWDSLTVAKSGSKLAGALLAVSALQGLLISICRKFGATDVEIAQMMASGRHTGEKFYDDHQLDDEEH